MDVDRTLRFLAARAIPGVEKCTSGRRPGRGLHASARRAARRRRWSPCAPPARRCRAPSSWPTTATWSQSSRGCAGCSTSTPTRRPSTPRWLPTPALAPLVRASPGLRSPGTVDGFELAIRALVGQQISVAGAAHRAGPDRGGPRRGGDDRRPKPPGCSRTANDARRRRPGDAADAARRATAVCTRWPPRSPTVIWTSTRAPTARRPAPALLALPGDRAVDRRLRRDARARRPGRAHVRRPGRPPRRGRASGIALTDGRPDWAPWRSYATHHLWTHAAPAVTTRPTTPPTRTEDTR